MDPHRNRNTLIVFVGSRNVMSVRLAVHLAEKIARLPDDVTILLRRAASGKLNTFESVIAEICTKTDHPIRWCVPEGGGGAVYKRDYEMVEQADRVEAYFREDGIMSGGTGHVVEAAMARDIPVYAWSVGKQIERVGELEP